MGKIGPATGVRKVLTVGYFINISVDTTKKFIVIRSTIAGLIDGK